MMTSVRRSPTRLSAHRSSRPSKPSRRPSMSRRSSTSSLQRRQACASMSELSMVESGAADSMPWKPGALSGHPDYEIHDELYTPDGRCVAVLECFTSSPDTYYCNALTPSGDLVRLGAGTASTVRRTGLSASQG